MPALRNVVCIVIALASPTLAQPIPAVAADDIEAPWQLTASDGSGLVLARVDAAAVVEGPLAFTELHLYFRNPEDRIREGTFAITLPTGAAVSRFAVEEGGRWQEAEVVKRAVARRVYEDFLHRRQDPALLEKAAGNRFSARVFPIEPHATKHLVVSYSQAVADGAYALPLRGLPQIERIDARLVTVAADGTRHEDTLTQRAWQPDRDFVGIVRGAPGAAAAGTVVVGAVAFGEESIFVRATDAPTHLTVLVDTSASRALGFTRYVTSVRELVRALVRSYGAHLELQVIAFDQDTQRIFAGRASAYGPAEDTALLARGAAGASDLGQVLDVLATSPLAPHRRVVIVSDGVLTAGPATPALSAAIARLPIERMDVALTGGLRDERLASSIARAGRLHAGDVYDLDRGIEAVAVGLGDAVSVDVPVEVPGALWVHPRSVAAVRALSSVMVFARMPGPVTTVDVTLGTVTRTLRPQAATPALVERAVAGAEIEELEARVEHTRDATLAARLREDIASRSVRARVVSSEASMLVLETDADYARYKIPRTALADILRIGPHGLEQTRRTEIVAAKERAKTSKPPTQEVQLVHRPQLGHGSGYGAGMGQIGMRRAASAPMVMLAQPVVHGDLDKSMIRRYIRRALPRIRHCYDRELIARPRLAGQLATRMRIDASGRVLDASATGFDDVVAACVANVLRTVEFPAWVGGGIVEVNYPFTFETPESAAADRARVPTVSADATTSIAVTADIVPALVAATAVSSPAIEPPAPPPSPTRNAPERDTSTPPLTGRLAKVMRAVKQGRLDDAYAIARPWHDGAPGDVLALIALGEVLEAKGDVATAARIYGSIIDLFPARADLRRFAGERLERLGAHARGLVLDTYRRAVFDRPDHVTGHRLLAYALVRDQDYAGAFAAILAGIDQAYPEGRFAGAERVLGEDAGMIGAVYLAHGGERGAITRALAKRSLALATVPSTRFIMYWETDANDVDFHIRDRNDGHAWYQHKELASGGELYADVTTGYGPECFAIQGTPSAGPYRVSINYYAQGPMGYGMGLLQIQRFDGKRLAFDDRPFVIMNDRAFVELGVVR